MSDGSPDGYDRLEDDFRDQLVAIGKGAVSLVPLFGGPLGEILGKVVPNQRADRIASYLRALAQRIDEFEATVRNDLASSKAKIDLIEEGGYQAVRATSEERIAQITEAVARGLAETDADVIRRRRLLVLLGELDEDELALLNAYGRSYGGQDRNAFGAISRPEPTHMTSSLVDRERERLYQAGKEHLLRLDLLKRNYGIVKKGQLPEFDSRKGDFRHSVEISFLGRLLLKEIGMPTAFDQARETRDDA